MLWEECWPPDVGFNVSVVSFEPASEACAFLTPYSPTRRLSIHLSTSSRPPPTHRQSSMLRARTTSQSVSSCSSLPYLPLLYCRCLDAIFPRRPTAPSSPTVLSPPFWSRLSIQPTHIQHHDSAHKMGDPTRSNLGY